MSIESAYMRIESIMNRKLETRAQDLKTYLTAYSQGDRRKASAFKSRADDSTTQIDVLKMVLYILKQEAL